jgi:hypothetical protein
MSKLISLLMSHLANRSCKQINDFFMRNSDDTLIIYFYDTMTDTNSSSFCNSTTQQAADLFAKIKTNSNHLKIIYIFEFLPTYHSILNTKAKLILCIWSFNFDFDDWRARNDRKFYGSLIFSIFNIILTLN